MATNILVVDDEPDLEVLLRQKFRKQIRDGVYNFAFARNGVEALSELKRNPEIEVVLTDINMPEMDGLTLLIKLSELDLLLRAVVVSAYGDLANIRTAMNRGAFDFLTKPIDFDDLDVTVEKTVRQVSLLKKAVHEHAQLAAITHELDMAREIQQSVLPSVFPPFPERVDFDVFAAMIPAKNVGGDFYDFFFLDDDHLALALGDVSGKGIPAALFMMSCRTLLRSWAVNSTSPAQCLSQVNRILCANNPFSMFVTLFYGVLDVRTGDFLYCNGGHNPPYRIKTEGSLEALDCVSGPALGFFEDAPYKQSSMQIAPNESLFLYSDGVTEAEDLAKAFFGTERFENVLRTFPRATPKEMVEKVVESVRRFSSGAEQSDDLTALSLSYFGKKG